MSYLCLNQTHMVQTGHTCYQSMRKDLDQVRTCQQGIVLFKVELNVYLNSHPGMTVFDLQSDDGWGERRHNPHCGREVPFP